MRGGEGPRQTQRGGEFPRLRVLLDIGPGETFEIALTATRLLEARPDHHNAERMDAADDAGSLDGLLDLWRGELLGRYRVRESHAKNSAINVRRLCREIGARRPEDLTPAALRRWMQGREHLAARTIRNRASELIRFADWLVETERLSGHDLRRVRMPVARKCDEGPGARALTPEEASRVVAAAEWMERTDGRARALGPNRSTLYLVLWHTTMRYSEAMRLTWADVGEGELRAADIKGKTGARRTIPLHAEACAALDNLRKFRGKPKPSDRVFQGVAHETLAADLTRAGVPLRDAKGRGGRWHLFRKGGATAAKVRGAASEDIAGLTGHEDPRMLDRYLDVVDERALRALLDAPAINGVLTALTRGGVTNREHVVRMQRGEKDGEDVEGDLTHGPMHAKSVRPAGAKEPAAGGSELTRGFESHRGLSEPGQDEVIEIALLALDLAARLLRLRRPGDRRAEGHHTNPPFDDGP